MLTQLPLPLLPPAAEIAPGVGVVTGAEGGLVLVHGLATFAWDAGDEAGRRLAAVQLVRLRAASQAQVAEAFGVDPVTVWRWDQALAAGGVAALVPARKGPRRASKLTSEVVAVIRGLDGQGRTLAGIAAAAGVSVSSVRNALGRNPARPGGATGPATGEAAVAGGAADGPFGEPGAGAQDAGGGLPGPPEPLVRDGGGAAARGGGVGGGAAPEALGFLHAGGHDRAYFGTRQVQKAHVARLKFPAPATAETWVTDAGGDPVLMVVAEPSASLAGDLKGLLPTLRQVIGDGRRVTVCFDRRRRSPAQFPGIIPARVDLLTYRKGPADDVPGAAFTAVSCGDDRGRAHAYDLADTTVTLDIADGPRKGEQVSLRQVTRRVPARRGRTRQVHTLTSRADLDAGEVCWRMSSRWREENYFRYARPWFALDALDSYAAA